MIAARWASINYETPPTTATFATPNYLCRMKQELGLHELESFATTFWQRVGNARVVLFYGQMGAGKTTIITALCRALGVQDTLGSPTFSIINEYADGQGRPVYHMDLYRMNAYEEAVQAGVEDCITSGHICLVEWPEKALQLFDETAVQVHLSVLEGGRRLVEVKGL
jgi:tRNA threonylcarbamoyladenosine biosynthesis protein TsaE